MKTVIALIVVGLTLVAGLGLAVTGCGIDVAARTGTIEVRVTDAPPGYEIISIVVTVSEEEGEGVEVHKAGAEGEEGGEGAWITLGINTGTFDLTQLENGLQEVLAVGEVDVGRYTQIRMNIASVVVTYSYLEDGESKTVDAVIPSGELKFVRPFEVVEGESTILLLDFDADKSVVITGATQSEQARVIFIPVVKLSIEPGEQEQGQGES